MGMLFYIDDYLPREAGATTIVAFARKSYPAEILPPGHPFFVFISRGKNTRVVQSDGLSRSFEDLGAVLEEVRGVNQAKLIHFDPSVEKKLKPILEGDSKWVIHSHCEEDKVYHVYWYNPRS